MEVSNISKWINYRLVKKLLWETTMKITFLLPAVVNLKQVAFTALASVCKRRHYKKN